MYTIWQNSQTNVKQSLHYLDIKNLFTYLFVLNLHTIYIERQIDRDRQIAR